MIILSENGETPRVELAESREIPESFTVQNPSADSAIEALTEDQKTIAMLTQQITAYRSMVLNLEFELARSRPPF